MSEPRRGDVVLVRFPFTDLRATKLRPAVVLACHGQDVIVVGIFSSGLFDALTQRVKLALQFS